MRNKTALITGASVGIGRAVALKMAQESVRLVLLDMNEKTLSALRDELKAYPCEALCSVCDVSNGKAVEGAVMSALERFGRIDILVNNAALWKNFESFLQTSEEKWRTFWNVNVMGVVHCTKAVLPQMLGNGYGRIINVASVAGVYGNADMAAYSATKGAVIAMTQSLAKEVIGKGVVVNCVSPGTVSDSGDPDVNRSTPTELCYAGRTGTDAENAELICFLASEKAGYIVGQNIQIDGCRKRL